jgi:hypothetical protein
MHSSTVCHQGSAPTPELCYIGGHLTGMAGQWTLSDLKAKSQWLSSHARDVTSQHGEDGILEKALSRIPTYPLERRVRRPGWEVTEQH